MTESDFALPVPSPSVVFKQLDEGGVLLSTDDEVYFGVNRVGARIWSLLPPNSRTFSEMIAVLAREFANVSIERIRRDTIEFLRELVAAGLATSAAGETPVEGPGHSSSPADAP